MNFYNIIDTLKNLDNIEIEKLFTEEFIKEHTKFKNLDDMFISSNLTVDEDEDFLTEENNREWDEYIEKHTIFNNWSEMKYEALGLWIRRKLLQK